MTPQLGLSSFSQKYCFKACIGERSIRATVSSTGWYSHVLLHSGAIYRPYTRMPFSCIHNPRYKLWSTILDIGEARLRASIHYNRNSDNPPVQRSLEEYCVELDRWLCSLLDEAGLPDVAIEKIVALLGSVGLSLLELEALTEEHPAASSSGFREVD